MKKIILLTLIILLTSFNKPKIKETLILKTESTNLNLQCSQFNQNGVQYCKAGINSNILNVVANDIQYANKWCWAASIQAVFRYYGHSMSQANIVQQTFGTIVNMSANSNQILSALNRQYRDDNGFVFTVTASPYNVNHIVISQELANNYPMIIGTTGHAMVLTAIEYYQDVNGNREVTKAIVRDPWPNNPRRRELTPTEWFSKDLLVKIRIYN